MHLLYIFIPSLKYIFTTRVYSHLFSARISLFLSVLESRVTVLNYSCFILIKKGDACSAANTKKALVGCVVRKSLVKLLGKVNLIKTSIERTRIFDDSRLRVFRCPE